jgi:hypothetical protein
MFIALPAIKRPYREQPPSATLMSRLQKTRLCSQSGYPTDLIGCTYRFCSIGRFEKALGSMQAMWLWVSDSTCSAGSSTNRGTDFSLFSLRYLGTSVPGLVVTGPRRTCHYEAEWRHDRHRHAHCERGTEAKLVFRSHYICTPHRDLALREASWLCLPLTEMSRAMPAGA